MDEKKLLHICAPAVPAVSAPLNSEPPSHLWLSAAHISLFVTGAQNIDACQNLLHFVNMRQETEKMKKRKKKQKCEHREIYPDTTRTAAMAGQPVNHQHHE